MPVDEQFSWNGGGCSLESVEQALWNHLPCQFVLAAEVLQACSMAGIEVSLASSGC